MTADSSSSRTLRPIRSGDEQLPKLSRSLQDNSENSPPSSIQSACDTFNDALSLIKCTAQDRRVTKYYNEWDVEESDRGPVRVYSGICLEGAGRTTKSLRSIRIRARILKPVRREY